MPSGEEIGTLVVLILALAAFVHYNNKPKGPRPA